MDNELVPDVVNMEISFDETLNCSEAQSPWDNVVDVTFQFLPVGKSKPPGMLTTHDLSFKYQRNQENRTGTTVYYTCYHKKVCISWFLSFFVVSWQNNIHYNMILIGWMSGQSNSGSCPSRSWERRGSWIQTCCSLNTWCTCSSPWFRMMLQYMWITCWEKAKF